MICWASIAWVLALVLSFALIGCGDLVQHTSPQRPAQPQSLLPFAYVLMHGELAAYTAETGNPLWHIVLAQPSATPSFVLRNDIVYLSGGDLYAQRAADGHVLLGLALSRSPRL